MTIPFYVTSFNRNILFMKDTNVKKLDVFPQAKTKRS